MTDLLRARTLSDLIGVVPALFGFHPHDSLVALCLDGPSGRAGFRLRTDLPPVVEAEAAARSLVGYLVAQEPEAVVLIAFAEEGRDHEARAVVDAMTEGLTAEGVRVVEAVRYDGTHYFSYSCTDPECCAPEGVPCDVASSPMLAEAVYRGLEVLPSRDDLVRRYAAVTGPARREAERATAREAAALGRRRSCLPAQRDPDLLRRGLDRVRPIVERLDGLAVADGVVLSIPDKAALAVWTSLIVVRDVLWSRITHSNAAVSLATWREVGVSAVAPFQAAPLTLAAFSAWLSGDGAQAQCALDRVAEVAPGYSMAGLVQTTLTGCLDPRAWQGIGEDDVLRTVPGLS
ncbi:DUF4192 domain-containing protein [Mumia sp. Pv 4-285]|uniref:DUF4192 domain-containing protein n=1 Tax=Mumia qirimensis TaxID=3234852 RepID=UPI00351CE915